MKRRILFVPFGSEGDVNPLFWLADGMVARGHDVVFLLSPPYGARAEKRGFRWFPVGTQDDFDAFAGDPMLWDKFQGPRFVIRGLVASLPAYREAFEEAGSEFDLVVTSSFSLAAASLAEAAGIPRLTLHFQPICLRSDYECPVFVPELAWMTSAPRWVKRLFFRLLDLTLWRLLEKPLNHFRSELGLAPYRQFYDEAVNGARGIAALFPDWFAAPQPDWPRHLRQFGFPVTLDPQPLPADLETFLQAGEPPVVWTHGSANFFVEDFQSHAIAVSLELGVRCLLVSLQPPGQPLPPGTKHCLHARFEDLFPRCRAVVHHGGIGTTAKCIAAGVPQLIVPRSHDQPDNAHRIVRLGIGSTVSYSQLGTTRLRDTLKSLLDSHTIATECRKYQATLTSQNTLPDLCTWAAELARTR